ncbi:MAG: DUF1592 domain-containing protein [Rhodospirillaceae bacterium]|nr:DUF1592 domain-containing protein [Rhodospirillaceae bacterium]
MTFKSNESRESGRRWSSCLRAMFTVTAILLTASACSDPAPHIEGAEPTLRRLTEQQYRNVVSDLFGGHIIVSGSFDPILRKDGLVSIGAGNATISASSFDKYEKLAHAIANQVVSEQNRGLFVPCEPTRISGPDESCAKAFLQPVGRLLFRRPLDHLELSQAVDLANAASDQLGSFYEGLAFGLTSLMVSPKFLFVIDEVKDASTEDVELTDYAKAARLSFFLWNTTPDVALLDAADSGALSTPKGLKAELDRMMQSPRLRRGVQAFFADMFHLDEFDHLEKDNLIYPAFDPQAMDDARKQLLLTIEHHLLDEDADYRDLFVTRKTFMSGPLGRVYRTPVSEPDLWTPYEFSDGEGRSGIQSLAGFIALHSHPGRSSPTIRGKAVRELLLCQTIPDPPADIDFSVFNEPSSQELVARERLDVHNSVPSCAGCHRLTDGIGLSLENYDGAGQFRTTDRGFEIDVSGNLDGIDYTNQFGLANALSQNPAIPACLVEQTLAYGLARKPGPEEKDWVGFLFNQFAEGGYRFKPLLHSVAASDNFFAVIAPQQGRGAETRVGTLKTPNKGSDS